MYVHLEPISDMLAIERILFPTDFSEGTVRTLEYAVRFSTRFQASLHVIYVNGSSAWSAGTGADYRILEKDDWSDAFKDFVRAHTADTSAVAKVIYQEVAGSATAESILQYAREQDIDLIVMGTHGHRGLGRLLLGSTAQEVTRLSTCPVLTVGGKKAEAGAAFLRRLLVPVDFSDHSQKALESARELADRFDASLVLLHVLQQVATPSSLGVSFPSLANPEVHQRARDLLEKMVQDLPGTEVHVVDGLPAHEIVEFAGNREIDVIVIATHGLTGFERFLMGSVTEQVLRLAPCPVFTVKSFA